MSTRDKLLSLFAEFPGRTLSGTDLARRLGQTRAAVWKTIRSLKEDGLPLRSVPRAGYRFDHRFDLSLFSLGQCKGLQKGFRFHYRIRLGSTQMAAKAAATQGGAAYEVWVAEQQSAGRGRLDRIWASTWGGLWFSILLRPKLPAARVPPTTLVAALVLREAILAQTGLDARLKWPNDLVLSVNGRWKKCAGILTEMAGDMDRTDWMVIGIGLNVNNHLPPELDKIACTLSAHAGRKLDRAALLTDFLERFRAALGRYERQGFESFRADYWASYGRPDSEVLYRTANGTFRGMTRGVDASGRLIIESDGRTHYLSEGEIAL